MFNGNGRTALLSGIANPSAKFMLEQGYNVVLCAHSQEQADQMTSQMPKEHLDRFMACYCMIGEEEAMQECLHQIMNRFGGLDVLALGIGANERANFDATDGEA